MIMVSNYVIQMKKIEFPDSLQRGVSWHHVLERLD